MAGILKFQPEDEQTVVARLLVELHSAIDTHFPNANPSGRQFSKTVLTSQAESTKIDNEMPQDRTRSDWNQNPQHSQKQPSHISLMHKSGMPAASNKNFSGTDDIRTIIGESAHVRQIKFILTMTLVIGIGIGIWLIFFKDSN